MYYGDYALGSTIYIPLETLFNNVMTSLSGGTVSVWAENSTVGFTSGVTLAADFDGVTGLNLVTVVATSGNTFASGKNYTLRLTAGTVGGQSAIGRIVGSFSIDKASVSAVTGAVASVTGNVGGNVVGSVGSVTGAVGSVTAVVSANVTKMNGSTVNGSGTSGDLWRGV